MSSENITGIIIIVLNIAGLCFMLIMLILAVKDKLTGRNDRTDLHSHSDKKYMKPDLTPGDLTVEGGDNIFDDMDLMDFDELNLDDFD